MNIKKQLGTVICASLCFALLALAFPSQTVNAATQTVWDYSYTGSYKTFTAPYTGTYELEVWGAQGGNDGNSTGGMGGYSSGTITLTVDQKIYVFVGGQGGSTSSGSIAGGWNGGGNGGIATTAFGSGGGGATDIRTSIGTGTWDDSTGLNSRIIVAGGGGGADANDYNGSYSVDGLAQEGGCGGGLQSTVGNQGYTGTGNGKTLSSSYATQTSGYSFGAGQSNNSNAAGGGGGWYGGYEGDSECSDSSGGSGYIGGVSDGSTVAGNTSFTSPSGTTETGQSGNGYARITLLDNPPTLTITKPIANQTFALGQTITLAGTLADSDANSAYTMNVSYNIDGGTTTNEPNITDSSTSTAFSYNITLSTTLTAGTHTLNVWATDSQGSNSVIQSISFYIDSTAPTGTYTLSPDDTTYGSVTIDFTASDDTGVASITLPDGSVVTSTTATYTVSGNDTYNFVVTDTSGNTATIPVTVSNIVTDTTVPTGTYTVSDMDTTTGTSTITLTAIDNESGVKSITLPDGTVLSSETAAYTVTANGTYDFIVTDNSGNTATVSAIVSNIGLTDNISKIVAGKYSWYVITIDGDVYSWGYNNYGELGTGSSATYSSTPTKISGLSNVSDIVINGDYSVYAITSGGDVYAWGYNNYGQLGLGSTTAMSTPTKISELSDVTKVIANDNSAFAFTSGGDVYAWGYNAFGQLGLGITENVSTPTKISGLSSSLL